MKREAAAFRHLPADPGSPEFRGTDDRQYLLDYVTLQTDPRSASNPSPRTRDDDTFA
jgi:hypothetical protein